MTPLAVLLALCATAARADTILSSTGMGWCNSGSCNNTNTSSSTNTAAGSFSGTLYNNWFAFALPNLGGTITSATISLWNPSSNFTNNSNAIYQLFDAAGITYAGLANGAVLGSDPLTSADTGSNQFVTITLNATALADLNSGQGSTFVFGGSVANATTGVAAEIFGYTNGTTAATLDLQIGAPVPEPGSWLLLATLLALAGVAASRQTTRSSANSSSGTAYRRAG